ncbi:MAG: lipopolysaccharide biosynthesis protein [Sedimentisphaerales bacterium]|nr:lipopolysaccharide biosynthesis protein [Sedimentisphaerales bacterium]
MSDGLKSKTLHGFFWSFCERFGEQCICFVISIILARLLLPEQFGLIGMLVIFMALAEAFLNSGFRQALIQKKNATYTDECSIFYFNILVGTVCAGLLWLAAPWIALFYKTPILVPLTRVLSLNLVFNAFGIIHLASLTRRVDFKTQMKVTLIATFLSGIIGITMAYRGFGVWSLVAQSLSINLFRTIFLWIFHRWRPALRFSLTSLKTMFAFGSKLLLAGLLDRFFKNIYLLVIGKLFTPAALGFYWRAKKFQELPIDNLHGSISRVTFPVFSSIQEDKIRLKQGVRKSLMALATTTFPMMIGLAVISKPLVLVLLTDKWLPCVPYLQLFCAVGILYPLHAINLNVLTAQGRSDLFLKLEIFKKILIIAAISVTYRWGITYLIIGQIITSVISYFLNTHYTGKLLQYPIIQQIKDIMPSLVLAAIMGGVISIFHYIPISSDILLLLIQVITGIVLYISLGYICRLSSFREIIDIVKPKLSSLRRLN